MKILLVRHTHVEVGKSVCYGGSDVALRAEFENDLVETAQKAQLYLPHPKRVFSSPLSRCVLLTQRITDTYTTDDRLKEMSFGDWELRPWNEIARAELDPWMENFEHNRPPNGESFRDIQTRVLEFWEELMQQHPDDDLMVVTHGGVIRSLVCHLLQIPLTLAFRFELEWGGVTQISIKNGLTTVNFINR
jgi:alpha-ribazole phosphatase